MNIAHLLLTCEENKNEILYNKIKNVKSVNQISKTFGAYNMVVKIKAKSNQEIMQSIKQIKNFPEIEFAITLMTPSQHDQMTNKIKVK